MFVRIDFEHSQLILNVNNISSIHYAKPCENFNGGYFVVMNNEKQYNLDKDHYEQLCKILCKQV